jgi:hypothetical protein
MGPGSFCAKMRAPLHFVLFAFATMELEEKSECDIGQNPGTESNSVSF